MGFMRNGWVALYPNLAERVGEGEPPRCQLFCDGDERDVEDSLPRSVKVEKAATCRLLTVFLISKTLIV